MQLACESFAGCQIFGGIKQMLMMVICDKYPFRGWENFPRRWQTSLTAYIVIKFNIKSWKQVDTHIYIFIRDRSHFWLGICTSIKIPWFKLFVEFKFPACVKWYGQASAFHMYWLVQSPALSIFIKPYQLKWKMRLERTWLMCYLRRCRIRSNNEYLTQKIGSLQQLQCIENTKKYTSMNPSKAPCALECVAVFV